ncbi:hypothetical protein A3H10_04905 [Candidatus Uhrbacteria bacterium RIFCSPLOWO2_12_FULL_46_10]|uniref:Thioredoxin domain-containing protein n=1 Tax=Candidatus Uhrbacteria bacterium RIFCSPLOWO2_01_FULL_47_25 TaxID=1802402 RepID=A0A1F7UU06_9BACT|nr:MAG: hypothetical protein UX68_C0010G0016 [Parcubacteria group bacterium GW2011_GWA2_46_9]OGL59313.1 MAG: hypothetical protein A2752_01435 [Candidatus Uhrbacteria bacterium RIFCSPHIGHO2_01_FULL_46_23]OGL68442.1 MAG: hypothetical protein A3D60_02380 [Candidatus Uhrbacteria bacterium RIFCSPHIGHO2_02_FULL_47_29]OGL75630.1 MAG: hypothetical protein A3E96_01155 [Candidatus Uhrbacteria bacterium RIFCSPHIGHO2_12_FULL_46_13]OGL81147.1 MAG: hypothetical protein A2936_00925 [Candidatus Uhrbacteria bac
MDKKTINYISGGIVVVAIIVGLVVFFSSNNSQPGKFDEFAKCLSDKGAVFYGAFWCPHCKNQKASFGKSVDYLNYVECSTPDGRGRTQECKDKKIEGYPTWEFSDGSRESGELSLSRLAEKTGCALPE